MGNTTTKYQEKKGKLTIENIMNVCRYIKNEEDYIKLMMVNKKYTAIYKKMRYNPFSIKSKKIFPKLTNQFLYSRNDKKIKGVKHVLVDVISYSEYIQEIDDDIYCCNIKYEEEDKEEYGEVIESECNWIGRCYDKEIREIEIAEHIRYCDDECFNGFTNLTRIELSPHLYKLPFKCFNNCKSLVEVNISYVTYIGDNCFSNCTRLREIQMNKDIGYVGKGSFWNCKSLVKIRSSGKIHIYQSIPYWVWMIMKEDNNEIEEIEYTIEDREKYGNEIPTEVKRIGNGCFEGSQIEEITIPSNVIDIGNDCFAYCNKLTNITLHEGIKEIPKGFMKYCGQIEKIQLPQSITKISTESFKECIKLKEININPNKMIIEKGAFEMCKNISYEE
ncbi:leucine rich repeat protein bspa family [Entamoeba histolytica]|uniref:Leucine rich repeat protein, BspA family n=3 Tax=Entamoeba histolytica TaxID=5759 RepID=B1N5B1_ENTH1|nr:uncharacterized protein EHI_115500 [Entamoeba histolytica HM-1:IMSS]EDS88847.1 leucine rich repeat protein, BspA family [Entamoeba histolytica HM-1:IMSS]ENY61074.1 leucine rich repeat protein, bspa family protein [Entamoeba histolytica HM-1:IMSS-A]GAT99377.1 leucine rich repeat protein bspa family [Entamoeba histolytica]|eukprot:XP_001914377.1 uncharacterized protein EHI_115500 [Entamoeba histolytica HM-1:IMSS]